MKQVLFSIDEVQKMIAQGNRLLLAGDESALEKLLPGKWIGGTIPYFIGENGGVSTREHIYVTEVPDFVTESEIVVYDDTNISRVYVDAASFSLSFIIIPATSKSHLSFAVNAPKYEGFATRPLVGWIAGVHLSDLGSSTPKVFDGSHL